MFISTNEKNLYSCENNKHLHSQCLSVCLKVEDSRQMSDMKIDQYAQKCDVDFEMHVSYFYLT